MAKSRKNPQTILTWENCLRALGVAIVIHETVLVPEADPTLITLAAALFGLPWIRQADKKLSGRS